jgi:DNA-binding transcriptional regulator YiaG
MAKKLIGKRGSPIQNKPTQVHGHHAGIYGKVIERMFEHDSSLVEREHMDIIEEKFRTKALYDSRFGIKLVEHMSQGLSYQSFAGVIGISKTVLDRWEEHEEWIEWKNRAIAQGLLYWERMLHDATTKEALADAKLMIFKLKNMFPDEYKDKVEVEGNMAPTQIIIKGLTGEDEDDDVIEAEAVEVVEPLQIIDASEEDITNILDEV